MRLDHAVRAGRDVRAAVADEFGAAVDDGGAGRGGQRAAAVVAQPVAYAQLLAGAGEGGQLRGVLAGGLDGGAATASGPPRGERTSATRPRASSTASVPSPAGVRAPYSSVKATTSSSSVQVTSCRGRAVGVSSAVPPQLRMRPGTRSMPSSGSAPPRAVTLPCQPRRVTLVPRAESWSTSAGRVPTDSLSTRPS